MEIDDRNWLHIHNKTKWYEHTVEDPSHKSHNTSDKYSTMNYFATEMCT